REAAFGRRDLLGKPALLGLEEFERNRVGIVRVKQLLLLVLETSYPSPLTISLAFSVASLPRGFVKDQLSQIVEQSSRWVNLQIMLLNEFFGRGDLDRRLRAVGPLLLAAHADEVRIDLSSSTACV